MTDDPCCRVCAGSAPFKMCRVQHDCLCHIERDLQTQKRDNALTYKDSTARTAIGNVMREQKARSK